MAGLIQYVARIRAALRRLQTEGQAPSELANLMAIAVERSVPQYAEYLRASLLHGYLHGAKQTAKHLPALRAGADIFHHFADGFGLAPLQPVTDRVYSSTLLPVIARGAQWLMQRIPFEQSEFKQLDESAKRLAFTVARTVGEGSVRKIRNKLAEAVAEGHTLQAFRKSAVEELATTTLSPSQVETVYRTNVGRAYMTGMRDVVAHPMVSDGFPYYLWTAVHDSRVRPEHLLMEKLGLNGTPIYRTDDPIFDIFLPPISWNCVLPGTKVAGSVQAAVRSSYSGQAFQIVTESGREFRVTKNHPVLTNYGWTRASSLQKGDELFRHESLIEVSADGLATTDTSRRTAQVNDAPTPIEDVFAAMASLGSLEHYGAERGHFHGDGQRRDGYIDVVWANCKLLDSFITGGVDDLDNIVNEVSRAGTMSGGGLIGTGGFSHPRPLECLRFGLVTKIDSVLLQAASDNKTMNADTFGNGVDRFAGEVSSGRAGHIEYDPTRPGFYPEPDHPTADGSRIASMLRGDLLNSHPGLVVCDKIASVVEFEYSGHVYDLQTVSGSIIADGIILGNCRCHVIAIDRETAASYGVKEAQKWVETGIEPTVKSWVKHPPFSPPEGWVPTGSSIKNTLA